MVYLDTTHAYRQTAKELFLIKAHIAPMGFICGHDYTHGYGGMAQAQTKYQYGVIEAVGEFVLHNADFSLVALSEEHLAGGHGSFYLQRLAR